MLALHSTFMGSQEKTGEKTANYVLTNYSVCSEDKKPAFFRPRSWAGLCLTSAFGPVRRKKITDRQKEEEERGKCRNSK
jgi:hypothetical protein